MPRVAKKSVAAESAGASKPSPHVTARRASSASSSAKGKAAPASGPLAGRKTKRSASKGPEEEEDAAAVAPAARAAPKAKAKSAPKPKAEKKAAPKSAPKPKPAAKAPPKAKKARAPRAAAAEEDEEEAGGAAGAGGAAEDHGDHDHADAGAGAGGGGAAAIPAAGAAAAGAAAPLGDYIYLTCIAQGSKLRVRVVSPGYNRLANCQFPRGPRVDGRYFRIPRSALSLGSGSSGTFFYRVPNNADIAIITAAEAFAAIGAAGIPATASGAFAGAAAATAKVHVDKVFKLDDTACVVCMDADITRICVPCGHMCLCMGCDMTLSRGNYVCPMCRGKIHQTISPEQME